MSDLQSKYVDVWTANYAIAASPQVLRTNGIGSCIAICLYDHRQKIGALIHAMLAYKRNTDSNPLMYVDSAITLSLVELSKLGVQKKDLVAKIVGGSNMFPALWSGVNSVGTSNILATKEILNNLGIPLTQEVTGGISGRNLEFDLINGNLNIYQGGIKI